MGVTVRGVEDAKRALAHVAAALADPTAAHTQAAQIITAAAVPPVRTGRLRQSIRPMPGPGARVGSDVRYAALVEHRTHFLAHAVTRTQPQWMAVYVQAAHDACRGS